MRCFNCEVESLRPMIMWWESGASWRPIGAQSLLNLTNVHHPFHLLSTVSQTLMQSNAIRVQQRKDFVSCLPADVLILIFEQSIVALDNNVSWNTASVHEAALERRGEFKGSSLFRVSHVSRTWRDIAIGCPSLWSKFALRLNCMTNVDSSLLSLYLKRSRSCLLDMDLTIGFYDPFSLSQTSARHLWTSVIAAIARWRRVSITLVA